MMRDSLKRLHQVYEGLGKLTLGEGSALGGQRGEPRSALGPTCPAAENCRRRIGRFPHARDQSADPHPDSDLGVKEANRPPAAVGVREEHDQHGNKMDWPPAQLLARREDVCQGLNGLLGESPESAPPKRTPKKLKN